MYINKYTGLAMAIVLGVVCSGMLRVAVADDNLYYQALTNLGPCASSRVLLMNNDTNSICPIQGQGYHDTSNTVVVGQTYWWHDDTPVTEEIMNDFPVSYYMNLQRGINHKLYFKKLDGSSEVLWVLKNCRTGSGAIKYPFEDFEEYFYNYLPWSSTCQSIDPGYYTGRIPEIWEDASVSGDNSNGVRQVATIIMRATTDSAIYSPLYEEGIGDIYFDVVNQYTYSVNSHIAIEVATRSLESVAEGELYGDIVTVTDFTKLKWERLPCEVYVLSKDGACKKDIENEGATEIRLGNYAGDANEYYRIRAKVNYNGFARFRIIRTDVDSSLGQNLDTGEVLYDYGDIILVDNIIVSYPLPEAMLTPTGIDSDGTGFAKIGRVGAFTEPFLSRGLDTAKPRMKYSIETNGLPSFIDWNASVTNSDFVWRWCYLNQAYGSWTTNKMTLAENGRELMCDTPISVTNRIGDIEYYYVADVALTHYKFFDFANDTQIPLPGENSGLLQFRYPDTTVEGVSNYWSRIREGVSLWQEMQLEALIVTNAAEELIATNRWTMELIGDHMWRGFVDTPTNYAGCSASIRFVGRNRWEPNGVAPVTPSTTWYFPIDQTIEIPMGGVAVTSIDGDEQRIPIDATSGYLMFEFNDESGAFTMNRAEYQDFNKWMPTIGQGENRYIGDYVNTSYVGRAKQEYTLDIGNWPISRSTSTYWWENFDKGVGDTAFPFNEPFGLNQQTPNGWTASNGMFINGMFSADANGAGRDMALQLQGRGLGTLSLIDPADVPKGVGTVSFSARLAQYLEFGDFYYYVDGTAKSNYGISAKVAMTNKRKKFSDVSTGSPSLSLVAYYRPGQGCYELRVTRLSANSADIWEKNGKMELAIYKWGKTTDPSTGDIGWRAEKLQSIEYNDTEGSYLIPGEGTLETDNINWSSMYFATHTSGPGSRRKTYLEGGIALKPSDVKSAYDDKTKMQVISVMDETAPFQKGSYGVCANECPGVFGTVEIHNITADGPYKSGDNFTTAFGKCTETDVIAGTIINSEWGSASASRLAPWGNFAGSTTIYNGHYNNGIYAVQPSQKVYLHTAPSGESSKWTDTGLNLTLTNYLAETFVFSPRTTIPANIQISVGGNQYSPRNDVAIDNVQLSQWAGDSSVSTDIGSVDRWAFTDGWVSGSTNDVYNGTGSAVDDQLANISECGYHVEQINDTEYVYVFTNTAEAVSFVPKFDITVKELLVLGGGGGGGPGGGGGGGGSAIWITNAVEYAAGETGIEIYVGTGGSGGSSTSSNINPGDSAKGGTSHVKLKNPLKLSESQTYRGYGGGAGGAFENSRDGGGGSDGTNAGGGGSARKSTTAAKGNLNYASGFGGKAADGSPGGGGGGGLRGVGAAGSNTAMANGSSVITNGVNGMDGNPGSGGNGGNGFPLSALGDSEIRYVIGDLLGDSNAWLGGGGGGGSGKSTNTSWGKGADVSGAGGLGGGGQGGQYTAITGSNGTFSYDNPGPAQGKQGTLFGSGGGGGSFYNPVSSSGNKANNWIIAGGKGGNGLVVMHVKIKDRFVMLQPMRGREDRPMSIRTPFLNGISLLSFSWKDAHPDAVLKVQLATNGVDRSNIKAVTESVDNGNWFDFGNPIRFRDMDDAMRSRGATNILMGLRAPVKGVVRILVDPNVVAAARVGSTNNVDSMYGTVVITGMKVFDEPELDDRSWWGWNIMPTCKEAWSSLYDPVTLGPGRSLGLNFTGMLPGGWTVADMNSKAKANDPENPFFAVDTQEDFEDAMFDKHDPFVQTPRFTNGIGVVMFKARVLDTNLTTESGWVTISACSNPVEDDDRKWDVLTNIEVTAGTTIFEPFQFRITNSVSQYQALRLTAWGASQGRQEKVDSGLPFGGGGTSNPTPIQRVLIDEVVVTQPMGPRLSFVNAYPFRHDLFATNSIPAVKISSSDEQPLLGEQFGMQVQVVPTGMEDELDKDSIRVYMAWYAGDRADTGDSPWGYENWRDSRYAAKKVELRRAGDWSHGNLVYRSHKDDPAAFITPQMAGDSGYKYVQYHIWAEYKSKNGHGQDPHVLSRGEWNRPAWYNGIPDPNDLNDAFCAYTVLDTISPQRAWINELNTFDGKTSDRSNQYIEVAVPSGYDISGWRLQVIKQESNDYQAETVARFGMSGIVGLKNVPQVNGYSFIALQSPRTKAANTHADLNDGTWPDSSFDNGAIAIDYPYALRLVRSTGVIEHEIVFMSTNISTSIVNYMYDGKYFWQTLKDEYEKQTEGKSLYYGIYAGADAYGTVPAYPGKVMSLGVYRSHGESESCWTNMMQNTPGRINLMADGTPQYIDPDYFDPPKGTNLWIYANIDQDSVNSLSMVIGNVTNTSAVIIVPQNDNGTFSTSIVYVVKKWFELDTVATNEFGNPAGSVTEATGKNGVWTLDLSNLKISDPESRKFEVNASTRDSSKISALGDNGIARDDPYYPAVVDWLQNYEEGDIRLAEFWNTDSGPYIQDGKVRLLNLKQMYWLDIPPVSGDPVRFADSSEWVLKGYMDMPGVVLVDRTEESMTNVQVSVTMMISNRLENTAHAPYMLRGLTPRSTSSNYNEHVSANWDSVTFNITGMLITDGQSSNIRRPLRWFTFCPESFTNFRRTIEIIDPTSKGSPGYSYGWDKFPSSRVCYAWSLGDDTNRPPITVEQLNDENAVYPRPLNNENAGNP